MSNGLYITATESGSGKSAIALGVMEMLFRKIDRVGFFRPIIDKGNGKDPDIRLMATQFDLDIPYESMYGITQEEADHLLSKGKKEEIFERIIEKYNEAKKHSDFILCEGTDFKSSTTGLEFDINAMIIKDLSCPVLLVANAFEKNVEDAILLINLTMESLMLKGCDIIGIIINRVQAGDGKRIIDQIRKRNLFKGKLVFAVPDEAVIGKPTVSEVVKALKAEVLFGQDQLYRHVRSFAVAAMQLRNFLSRIHHGTLIITPGDRADVIVACLATISSTSMEKISGIVLTGGLKPEKSVIEVIKGFRSMVPVLSVPKDTFETAVAVEKIQSDISPDDHRKITRALALFEQNIDIERLGEKVITSKSSIVTPKMFEFEVLQKARAHKKRIVLPEGEEERILHAAEILLRREIVELILLGNKERIVKKIKRMGLRLGELEIIEPLTSQYLDLFTQSYFELRSKKGITRENAADRIMDLNFFGTMMVHHGLVDGMVSGSVHSTAATIKPAFEIIRAKPGSGSVSSVIFMCLADKVLAYGDCAVNPEPDAETLAEIAVTSAETARMFGINPRIAMLSYSTGSSGKGKDVDKVRQATHRVQEKRPDLLVEGPIQYDAAVEPDVARTKLPGSRVAGRATVLIFPDLNTGNNTYKAVQRSSGAIAVGPILQGLNKPVNDLSRGCLVTDIVNTVAITAVQAQEAEKETP
ncbi:phosphate acetyltransferase [Desulfospira joergensenii]|uniref:phosphate acetyltransferase n=1 Tax=Desulfospira joergensenii TaxID=53329 RepID=UPI0003B775E0|nr:phosphate acetyltransferase [Desulfospira joergensenii]